MKSHIQTIGERGMQRFAEAADLHVDAALTQLSIGYANEESVFIADQVAPRIRVTAESDKYYVWDDAPLTDDGDDLLRADKADYANADWSPTTSDFQTEEYGIQYPLGDREVANAEPGADPDAYGTRVCTHRIMLARERRIATLLTNTAVVPNNTTLSGTDQWDDYVNSDPETNVETARESIHTGAIRMPNTLVMGRQVLSKLKRHPGLLETFKYTSGGQLTLEQLADLFEVDRILVGDGVYNSANEGQTASNAFIWGKHVIMMYVPPSPTLFEPAAAYQLVFQDQVSERYRSESNKVTVIRVREEVDEIVPCAPAVYLIKDAVS